jgi:virulence factor Mce-like protein
MSSVPLHRLAASRAVMSVAAVLAATAATVAAYATVLDPPQATTRYCAIMPDTIGLYTGNHVSLRGIPVGTVTGIRPEGTAVRVDFEIAADHRLHGDAAATTLSRTLVADRELAVLDGEPTAPAADTNRCLTRTATPKSMTETFDALATLSEQLLAARPGEPQPMGRAVAALNAATAGSGPQLNTLIRELATGLHAPDAAIGHLAGSVDSLYSVSGGVAAYWGDIETMLTRLAGLLDQVNHELFNETVSVIDGFQRVLPMLNDITTMFGEPILTLLDATLPVTDLVGAHVNTLREIIGFIPPLLQAWRSIVNPAPDGPGLVYSPPRVELPAADAQHICAAAELVAPGMCAAGADGVRVDVFRLVLAMAGGR